MVAGFRRRGATAFCLVAATLLAAVATADRSPAAVSGSPDVVVILTDDMTLADLYQRHGRGKRSTAIMHNTLGLIAARGVTFTRAYSSYPLSCPSRVSYLSGQYAHNHRTLANFYKFEGDRIVYCSDPGIVDHSTLLPAWLQARGYQTWHLGRFLNGYPGGGRSSDVPPGWDQWRTPVGFPGKYPAANFFNYILSVNGTLTGPQPQYFTDLLDDTAASLIRNRTPGRPFFLALDHRAPHEDASPPVGPAPAPRHRRSLKRIRLPNPPSVHERDRSDKPNYVRKAGTVRGVRRRKMAKRNRRRLQSLKAVDDGVKQLIDTLAATGELGNTYLIFTSDNGFFRGEHGFKKGKVRHYEPATHIPLLIAGPGIPAGRKSQELVSNADLAPTIAQITGASATRVVDGRSMLRFARRPKRLSRRPVLLESFFRKKGRRKLAGAAGPIRRLPNYQAIRYSRYKYVRYADGERELYDLVRDPYELNSLHRNRRYRKVRRFLRRALADLGRCNASDCRRQLAKPPKPLPRKKRKSKKRRKHRR